MALSNEDRQEIANTIKLVVNGNIKRVEDKLDGHIEKHTELLIKHQELITNLEPVVEAVQWINTTKKAAVYFGGFILAVGGLIGSITALNK